MRVVVVSDELHREGGAPAVQLTVGRELAQRDHQVALAYSQAGQLLDDWAQFASPCIELPSAVAAIREKATGRNARLATNALELLAGRLAGRKIGRQPGSVVYMNGHGESILAKGVADALNAGLVMHLHSPPWPLNRLGRQKRDAMLAPDLYVAVSDSLARSWIDAGLPGEKVHVVRNGVAQNGLELDRGTARESLGIPERAFVVGFAGRVVHDKGVHVLIETIERLSPRPHLLIAGFLGGAAGRDDAEYEASVKRAGERIGSTMLPMQPSSSAVLAAADVVACPSVYPDPYPLVVIESLVAGRPVVASEIGGAREALPEWLRSLCHSPGDSTGLAEAIEQIRSGRFSSEVSSLQSWAVEEHSLDAMIDKVEGLMTAVAR